MTSFCMISLHVDLNEAAKCVDISTTHIASLLIAPSHTRTKYKMATILGPTYEEQSSNFESLRHENFERTHDWCSAVGKVAF